MDSLGIDVVTSPEVFPHLEMHTFQKFLTFLVAGPPNQVRNEPRIVEADCL